VIFTDMVVACGRTDRSGTARELKGDHVVKIAKLTGCRA